MRARVRFARLSSESRLCTAPSPLMTGTAPAVSSAAADAAAIIPPEALCTSNTQSGRASACKRPQVCKDLPVSCLDDAGYITGTA